MIEHVIQAEMLTKEGFSPYGRLLEQPSANPTKSGKGWCCFSDIERLYPDSPMMVGLVLCNAIPEIDSLEAHTSREELLWTTDKDIIMVVAAAKEMTNPMRKPDISTAKAFLIKAGQAVIIANGTWHSPGYSADGKEAKYYFLVEAKPDTINQDAAPWIPFQDGSKIKVIL